MKKLVSLAAGLVGVVVLVAAGRAGCLPGQDGGYVKVHFQRTPGVNDFNYHPPLDLNGKDLSAEELKQLRKLIDDAGFFELESSPTPPPQVPDPPAGYDVTVDRDGRTHHVWVVDGAVSASLKPLIDWLTARAKPIDLGGQTPVPVRTVEEEEQPAVRIAFTKGGGIAGFRWTAKVDSTTLSPEDAQKLAQLIADARFFEQPEQFPLSGTADGFGYTITVEMNGKRHTVNVDEGKVPAEMRPLVEWLSGRAEEEGPVGCLAPPA